MLYETSAKAINGKWGKLIFHRVKRKTTKKWKEFNFHIRSHILPYLDAPVAAAGCENVRVELVVVHAVDGKVVRIIGHQISAKVENWATELIGSV